MNSPERQTAVAARFEAVNGAHPMTPDDDAYVTEWFVQLEDLAASSGHDVDRLRELILADRLPLPSYIRSERRWWPATCSSCRARPEDSTRCPSTSPTSSRRRQTPSGTGTAICVATSSACAPSRRRT